MNLQEWCEYMRDVKEVKHLTNAYISKAADVSVKTATASVPTMRVSDAPETDISTGSSDGTESVPETGADSAPRELTSLTLHAAEVPRLTAFSKENASPCPRPVATVSFMPS
jgi:hypothetical protein